MLADKIPIILFDAQYANEHYTKDVTTLRRKNAGKPNKTDDE